VSEGTRRLSLALGILAAAAGVAVGSYVLVSRRRRDAETPPLRTVQEILTDCYGKMREIQRHLGELQGPAAQAS